MVHSTMKGVADRILWRYGEPFSKRRLLSRARRVTGVAASILPSHVQDQRLRALRLDFKSGDEGVFGVDDHMFGFALELQSDSELHRALLTRLSIPH
jgi:hypothetical protein